MKAKIGYLHPPTHALSGAAEKYRDLGCISQPKKLMLVMRTVGYANAMLSTQVVVQPSCRKMAILEPLGLGRTMIMQGTQAARKLLSSSVARRTDLHCQPKKFFVRSKEALSS